MACQVQGCKQELRRNKAYFLAKRICPQHVRASVVQVDGQQMRFCQQCGRLHDLHEFEGNKRSCRASLNKRKELYAATMAASDAESFSCLSPGDVTAAAAAATTAVRPGVLLLNMMGGLHPPAYNVSVAWKQGGQLPVLGQLQPVLRMLPPWLEGGLSAIHPAAATAFAQLHQQQQQWSSTSVERQQQWVAVNCSAKFRNAAGGLSSVVSAPVAATPTATPTASPTATLTTSPEARSPMAFARLISTNTWQPLIEATSSNMTSVADAAPTTDDAAEAAGAAVEDDAQQAAGAAAAAAAAVAAATPASSSSGCACASASPHTLHDVWAGELQPSKLDGSWSEADLNDLLDHMLLPLKGLEDDLILPLAESPDPMPAGQLAEQPVAAQKHPDQLTPVQSSCTAEACNVSEAGAADLAVLMLADCAGVPVTEAGTEGTAGQQDQQEQPATSGNTDVTTAAAHESNKGTAGISSAMEVDDKEAMKAGLAALKQQFAQMQDMIAHWERRLQSVA